MTLSKRGDYVMRSAVSLARAFDEGGWRKIREVVAHTEVPATFASQILADLVRGGLATSKAGRDGGYRLSRAPSEISVLEVIEAAEGPLRAERCALGEGPCRWEAVCPLHETWSEATVALRALLSGTSLADIADRDAALEAGTYEAPPDSHRLHTRAVAVADVVQVELPAAQVHAYLARSGPDLGPLAARAVDGELLGRTSAPVGPLPLVESSLELARVAGAGQSPLDRHYLLEWRVPAPPGVVRLEAELSVAGIDPERSEVRIEGTWHHEARPDLTSLLPATEGERLARRAVRGFLRQLASMLEQSASSSEVTLAKRS